jgi:hypothetical protein
LSASWNPRYVAFARSQGRAPEAQREHDREQWPGAAAVPFMLWIREQWRAFFAERGEKVPEGIVPAQHESFNQWLEAKFPAESESKVLA